MRTSEVQTSVKHWTEVETQTAIKHLLDSQSQTTRDDAKHKYCSTHDLIEVTASAQQTVYVEVFESSTMTDRSTALKDTTTNTDLRQHADLGIQAVLSAKTFSVMV